MYVRKLHLIREVKGYPDFIKFSELAYPFKTLPSHFQQHDSSVKGLRAQAYSWILGFRCYFEASSFRDVQHATHNQFFHCVAIA
jgi:hypothetical protein